MLRFFFLFSYLAVFMAKLCQASSDKWTTDSGLVERDNDPLYAIAYSGDQCGGLDYKITRSEYNKHVVNRCLNLGGTQFLSQNYFSIYLKVDSDYFRGDGCQIVANNRKIGTCNWWPDHAAVTGFRVTHP